MTKERTILLGLGSNIGNKLSYLNQAINIINSRNLANNIQISPIYESKALLIENSPQSWNQNFFNLCICGTSHLGPHKLLKEIKKIEITIGRQDRGKWSPREIDIDILLYNNLEMNSDNLTIPHKHFLERDFTLLPANDLIPNYCYHIKGQFYKKSLKEIIKMKNIDNSKCWKTNHIFIDKERQFA